MESEERSNMTDGEDKAKTGLAKANEAIHHLDFFLNVGKERVATRLDGIARVLNGSEAALREEEHEQIATYVAGASDAIRSAAGFIRDHETTDLLREVERVARQNPLYYFGGAVALGLVAGRFLKAATPSTSGVEIEATPIPATRKKTPQQGQRRSGTTGGNSPGMRRTNG